MPSGTVVAGALASRPCVVNPRTTAGDIDDLVTATVAIGDETVAGGARNAGEAL